MMTSSTPLDAALVAPPLNTTPGPEYHPAQRLWQGIPSLAWTPPNSLWVAWYSGGHTEGPANYVCLARSRDGGATWQDPLLVMDPPQPGVRAFDPAVWCDPHGRLWVFWAQTYSSAEGTIWDGRGGVWATVCHDPAADTPTWTPPRRLADGIMLNKPLATAAGEWLLPVSVWGRAPLHPAVEGRRLAGVVASLDEGQTFAWRGGSDIPDRIFDEHHLVERRDGALWLCARTLDGIAESFSVDGGRTWSPARKNGLPCPNARFHLRRLRSGNLLLVTHWGLVRDPANIWSGRNHLCALLSTDDGQTWGPPLLLDERDPVSYPDADEDDRGRIHISYDFSRTGEREILLATVTEDDLRAGRLLTSASGLRRVISRASGTAAAFR